MLSKIFELSSTGQFNLYKMNQQHNCLHYYVFNDIIDYEVLLRSTHQIIPDCLQLMEDDRLDRLSSDKVTSCHSFFIFAQLKKIKYQAKN